jgi:hypothetical protein
MSHHKTPGQNLYIKVAASNSFKNVTNLKNFGMTVTNQNCIPEGIN